MYNFTHDYASYLLGLNQMTCNVIVYFFYLLIFYISFNLDVFFFFLTGGM
jgi:hypothetical protein